MNDSNNFEVQYLKNRGYVKNGCTRNVTLCFVVFCHLIFIIFEKNIKKFQKYVFSEEPLVFYDPKK